MFVCVPLLVSALHVEIQDHVRQKIHVSCVHCVLLAVFNYYDKRSVENIYLYCADTTVTTTLSLFNSTGGSLPKLLAAILWNSSHSIFLQRKFVVNNAGCGNVIFML